MDKRTVDTSFINAMERKLEHGREQGIEGWDSYWNGYLNYANFYNLFAKFGEEIGEVFEAVSNGNFETAADECPDVANMAMMLWDFIHQLLLEFDTQDQEM